MSKHAERREAELAAEAADWNTQTIEPAQPGDIPTIDLSGWSLSDDRAAQIALQLGRACREVGFFYLVGHGVPQSLIDSVLEQNRRFHSTSQATKQALAMDQPGGVQGVGYLPLMHQKLPRRAVGNNNEAFIVKRDGAHRLANNLWPSEQQLPGFRGVLEQYANASRAVAAVCEKPGRRG